MFFADLCSRLWSRSSRPKFCSIGDFAIRYHFGIFCDEEMRGNSIYPSITAWFVVQSLGFFFFYFLQDFIYLFLKIGEGGRKRRREINVQDIHQLVSSCMPPAGDLTHNPGMCPDWESKKRSFWFAGQCSNHWATQARAGFLFFCKVQMFRRVTSVFL